MLIANLKKLENRYFACDLMKLLQVKCGMGF